MRRKAIGREAAKTKTKRDPNVIIQCSDFLAPQKDVPRCANRASLFVDPPMTVVRRRLGGGVNRGGVTHTIWSEAGPGLVNSCYCNLEFRLQIEHNAQHTRDRRGFWIRGNRLRRCERPPSVIDLHGDGGHVFTAQSFSNHTSLGTNSIPARRKSTEHRPESK